MVRRNVCLIAALPLIIITSAAAAPKGMVIVSKVPIPANREVVTIVKLPPGSHKVDFSDENGSFFCKSVTLSSQDGSKANVFTRSDMPVNFHETMGAGPGSAFVAANISCRGGPTDAQLVVASSQ